MGKILGIAVIVHLAIAGAWLLSAMTEGGDVSVATAFLASAVLTLAGVYAAWFCWSLGRPHQLDQIQSPFARIPLFKVSRTAG